MFASIKETAEALKDRRTTSVLLVSQCLQLMEKYKHYNAIISIKDTNTALEEARMRDAERSSIDNSGLLCIHGIPIVVKDNIYVKGMPTTAGALMFKDAFSNTNTEFINNLLKAGVIIIAKSNMTEFGCEALNSNPIGWSCLGGQCLNGYSGNSIPVGSSSGSAAIVALGACLVAIGSETSHSIIGPCNAQGVVGYRPSDNIFDASTMMHISPTLDTVGPICSSIEDIVLVANAMVDKTVKTIELNNSIILQCRIGISITSSSNNPSCIDVNIVKALYEILVKVQNRHNTELIPLDAKSDQKVIDKITSCTSIIIGAEFKDQLNNIGSYYSTIPSGVSSLDFAIQFNEMHPESMHPLYPENSRLKWLKSSYDKHNTEYKESYKYITTEPRKILDKIFYDNSLDIICTVWSSPTRPYIYTLAYAARYCSVVIPLGMHETNEYQESIMHPWFCNSYGQPYGLIIIAKPGHDNKLLCIANEIERIIKER